jgi:hypothetical protein
MHNLGFLKGAVCSGKFSFVWIREFSANPSDNLLYLWLVLIETKTYYYKMWVQFISFC